MKPKLLLFDIDGTILSAHDAPRKAMSSVLAKRYIDFRYDRDYDFSGRTDPQIVEHLLRFDQHPGSSIQYLITKFLNLLLIPAPVLTHFYT